MQSRDEVQRVETGKREGYGDIYLRIFIIYVFLL